MFVTEFPEGPIRDAVEAGLDACPAAQRYFSQDDLQNTTSELAGSDKPAARDAARMLRAIGHDGRRISSEPREA